MDASVTTLHSTLPPADFCVPSRISYFSSLAEGKESFLTYQNNSRHDVIVSYILSTFLPLSHLLKAKFQVLVHFQPLCLVFSSRLKSKQSFMSKIWRLLTNRFQKNFLLVFLLQLLQVYDQYLRNVPNYW